MTAQAVMILLQWATDTDKGTQAKFANYYEKHKKSYMNNIALGGRDGKTFTSDMARVMIETFEASERDEEKRWKN